MFRIIAKFQAFTSAYEEATVSESVGHTAAESQKHIWQTIVHFHFSRTEIMAEILIIVISLSEAHMNNK